MIDPDEFDLEENRSVVCTSLWRTSINGVPAPPHQTWFAAQMGKGASGWLVWFICAIVVIGIIALALFVAAQQRQQHQMRIQQEAALWEQQRQRDEAAERKKREEIAEAKRVEDEKRQAERERLEVIGAAHKSSAFEATERAASAGVNTVAVSVRNRCQAGDVHIAFLYHSISSGWVTQGWWPVKPGVEITPAVWPTSENIYFFAEGAGFTWAGGNAAPQRYIANYAFMFTDNESIVGRHNRLVRFRQATGDVPGHLELTCKVSQ
jgi:hypothetical protein